MMQTCGSNRATTNEIYKLLIDAFDKEYLITEVD
jgi:hypothetical protein